MFAEVMATSLIIVFNVLKVTNKNSTKIKSWWCFYFKKQVPEVFLKTSQNSQENICFGVYFLINLLQLYSKRDSSTGVFV